MNRPGTRDLAGQARDLQSTAIGTPAARSAGMRLAIALVLCARVAAADDDMSDLVPGKTVLGSKQMTSVDATMVALDGPAPAYEVMRAQAKAAQKMLLARGGREHAGIVLTYPRDGLMAASVWKDGRFSTAVGNGGTMLEDAREYEIEAQPVAKRATYDGSFGSLPTKGVACSGVVKNTTTAPLDIGVRCTIYGHFEIRERLQSYSDPAKYEDKPIGEKLVSLGKVAPGASKSYSFQVTQLAAPTAIGKTFRLVTMTFGTAFESANEPTPYYDPRHYREGVAWLGLVAEQRKLGFKLNLDKFERGKSYLDFDADDVAERDRTRQSNALLAKVRAHYKTYFDDGLTTIYVHAAGKQIAALQNHSY
jgi:hypothetical protein